MATPMRWDGQLPRSRSTRSWPPSSARPGWPAPVSSRGGGQLERRSGSTGVSWHNPTLVNRIAVMGAGYVGLTTAACLADLGNQVCVVDIDHEKIRGLRRYRLHFYEPGLQELVERNARAERLRFTTSYAEAVPGAEFAFIAVATPEGQNGEADLSYVERAACSIAQNLDGPLVVINKSTVPIGTGDIVSHVIKCFNTQFPWDVVSNPEVF